MTILSRIRKLLGLSAKPTPVLGSKGGGDVMLHKVLTVSTKANARDVRLQNAYRQKETMIVQGKN